METTDEKSKEKEESKISKPKPKVKTKKQGKSTKSSHKAVSDTMHGANGLGEIELRIPKPGEEWVLDSGIKVKFHRIALAMIREARTSIPDPDTSKYEFTHPDTGIKAFNPDHPEYHLAVKATNIERERAGLDILVAMGIELVDGVPSLDSEEWARIKTQLAWLTKKKRIDTSDLDLDDELDREFAYKKYVVADTNTIRILNALNGYSAEGIAAQATSFQDDS